MRGWSFLCKRGAMDIAVKCIKNETRKIRQNGKRHNMNNKPLGRGLSSLIPQKINPTIVTGSGTPMSATIIDGIGDDERGRILQISPDKIVSNPRAVRLRFAEEEMKTLAESTKEYGVIQPIIVTKLPNGKYELISGERRLRAARMINLPTVPAILRKATEQQKLELNLIENLQKSELNTLEVAYAYRTLVEEFGLSYDDLSYKVGRCYASIKNTMVILNLPKAAQEAVMNGQIDERHCVYLNTLNKTPEKQMEALQRMVAENMSTREAKQLVDSIRPDYRRSKTKTEADMQKEYAFHDFFKTKIKINRTYSGGGKIIIEFTDNNHLDSIVQMVKERTTDL